MPIIMTFPLIDAGFIYRLNSLDKGSFTLEIFLLESLGVFAQRHITCETQGKICLVQSNFDQITKPINTKFSVPKIVKTSVHEKHCLFINKSQISNYFVCAVVVAQLAERSLSMLQAVVGNQSSAKFYYGHIYSLLKRQQ